MDIYFSADIETDGSIPGPYSMLSFAMVYAGAYDGETFYRPPAYTDSFYTELRPISDSFEPEAMRINMLDRDALAQNGADPQEAMSRAAEWVRHLAHGGEPVFVAYPLSFDWMWLYWYFVSFSETGSPFGYSRCFDIKTAMAVKLSRTIGEAGRGNVPSQLKPSSPHTHHALDDAIEQAEIFANLLCLEKAMSRDYLDEIRARSLVRFEEFQGRVDVAEALVDTYACVYATGSFGRLEAGPHSDLDLFIVVDTKYAEGKGEVRKLDSVAETKVKYHLIRAVEDSGIAKFDAGGRYLESHARNDFIRYLGSQEDDFRNTLTGRLLLLLESRPVLGRAFYDMLLDDVISAYFEDFPGNENNFVPSFLVNDILRLWRTFCVNYEFSRKKGSDDIKLKNLKLKFSRMLTCYSAVIHLLAIHVAKGCVTPDDVRAMVGLTPVERLEQLQAGSALTTDLHQSLALLIEQVLVEYSNFLAFTHQPKDEAVAAYPAEAAQWKDASYRFGQRFAEALAMLGAAPEKFNKLYRMILI
ncbi:hypothetical protein QP150_10180 [Sphingomonas sp. 22L2VL55-3]